MQVTMGTSPTESMGAAGNIFLGQVNNSLNNKQQQQKANHLLLLKLYESLIALVPNQPRPCRYLSLSDRITSLDSSIHQWANSLRDPCCDDRRFCQHLW